MKNRFINSFVVQEANSKSRSFGLDLVRTIAISLVIVSHGNLWLYPGSRIERFINPGLLGVELFFVLSGFLIGRILITEVFNKPTLPTLTNFWIRRWFRTLPNYYLYLFVCFWISSARGLMEFWDWKSLLFLQNFAWPMPNSIGVSWSLCIEEWFYIVMGAITLLAGLRTSKLRSFGLVVLVTIATGITIRMASTALGPLDFDSDIRKVVIMRVDAIGYGVALAVVNSLYGETIQKFKWGLGFIGLVITIACLILQSHHPSALIPGYFYNVLFLPIVDIGAVLIIIPMITATCKSDLVRYTISHISIVSYSAYLFHASVVIVALYKLEALANPPKPLLYAVYLLAVIVLSTLVYNLFEKIVVNKPRNFFHHNC